MSKPLHHHLPNTITSLSLVSGCCAIVLAFQPGYLAIAPWLIVLSAVLDFLDGFTARLLKAYSELGKQLDSLADVVSFGVSPGIISFQLIRQILVEHNPSFQLMNASGLEYLILAPALIFPVFSALRLAKFNIDNSQTYSFRGLPTPGSALVLAFLVLSYFHTESSFFIILLHSIWIFPLVLIILSYLMVSPLNMLSLKFSNGSIKDNYLKYLLILLALVLIPWLTITGCLLTLLGYLILSIVYHIQEMGRKI
jgi:CDP-diacylglycerol---serine O-phosphatidyltransferase